MDIANRFVIFICLCIGSSCSFYNEPLTIARQNYTGTDFRIDGYYHTDIVHGKCIEAMFFYLNGIVYFTSCYYANSEVELDARINRNEAGIRYGVQQDWGVFTLSDAQLTIEGWDYAMGAKNGRNWVSKNGHIGSIF